MILYPVSYMAVTMGSLTYLIGEDLGHWQRSRKISLGLLTLIKFENLALEPSSKIAMRYQETLSMQLKLMNIMTTPNGKMLSNLSLSLWMLTKSSRTKSTRLIHLL